MQDTLIALPTTQPEHVACQHSLDRVSSRYSHWVSNLIRHTTSHKYYLLYTIF